MPSKKKSKKVVNAQSYRTHAIFECQSCGEEWQALGDSRAKAYQHAKKMGHKVTGEIGTAYHYNV